MKDIRKDIDEAEKLIEGALYNPFKPFSSHSSIYSFTNEKANSEIYKKTLENKEKILTIVGSGDQILNSILLGSKDITATDISNFTEYYFNLKLKAVKALTYEEYLEFFDLKSRKCFKKELYEKILPFLDRETAYFWSVLFSSHKTTKIRKSDFFMPENNSFFTSINIKDYIKNNPYLSSPDNYKKLKSKINDVNINIIIGNIFALIGTLRNGYDLVNASNIMDYHHGSEYLFFLEQCDLKEDGVILGYSMARGINADNLERAYTNGIVLSEGHQLDKKHKLLLTRKR